MQFEIKSIHERVGVTVVYVTHDQDEALTMSDRIAIFNRGVIEQIADPKTLYDNPENAFVATFIGDSNLLGGALKEKRDGRVLVEIADSGTVLARAGDQGDAPEAFLAIRPENLSVSSLAQTGTENNVLAGTIDKIVYFGDHLKLVVRLRGGQTVSVKTTAEQAYQSGQAVSVSWSPDHSIAFTTSPGKDGPRQKAVTRETMSA
jgi:putative spermidine/putrescine transport system ATP-binding protein